MLVPTNKDGKTLYLATIKPGDFEGVSIDNNDFVITKKHDKNDAQLYLYLSGDPKNPAGEGNKHTIVTTGKDAMALLTTELKEDKTQNPVFTIVEKPSVSYHTHVENMGWQDWVLDGQASGTQGKSLRLEGIEIKTSNNIGIEYRTHIQDIGWEKDWKTDGTMSGTTGLSKRLEAINIKLTGKDAKKFDIYYQVHAENFGWLDWAKNGDSAGTAGFAYRLEGIRVIIQPKTLPAPGATEHSFYKKGN